MTRDRGAESAQGGHRDEHQLLKRCSVGALDESGAPHEPNILSGSSQFSDGQATLQPMRASLQSVRRVVLVLYALVLLFLIATSSPRLVGDGGEYRAMAVQLASGHVPRPGATSSFLAYSALAVPGIWVTHWMGTNDLYAFTALNVSLLLSAAFVALRRLHWSAVLLVFVSPILWWVDKAHTEPFTFSLVTITLVLCVEQPSWAFVAAGLAATRTRRLRSSLWLSR